MKKQVDYDFRSFNLTPDGGQDGTTTRQEMLKFLKENYPLEDGWEVVSVHPTHVSAGPVNLGVFLVKYEVE